MQHTLTAHLATPDWALDYVFNSCDEFSHAYYLAPRLAAINSLALRTAVEASAA